MKKRRAKKSVQVKDLPQRKRLLGAREMRRGVVAVLLGGFNEGTDAATTKSVIDTSGKDATSSDTSVDQDHY